MTTKTNRSSASLALTVTACAALSALSAAGCAAAPPQPVQEPAVVAPPPASAAPPLGSSAPLPLGVPTPSAAPAPVDRKNCQPHPPAVKFEVKDDDVVTSLDAAGCPLGESHFKANGYSYKASVDFMTELQRLLKAGDKKALSELVTYPLRVNCNKGPLIVKDRAAFLREFDQIYSPGMVDLILKQDPRDVFCKDQGIMLGLGFIWAAKDRSGHLGVTSVNPLG
ncbi:MAG: hypothetical protein ACMG6S_35725 [Byssovorax sp.]